MLRSEQERVERHEKDAAARKKHWHDLLSQLRALNPSQKIVYRKGSEIVRDVVIDDVPVKVRLDEQRGGYGMSTRGNGVYYFTIGGYRRHAGPRPRAKQKKSGGFDWPRVAQLIEEERKYVVAEDDGERLSKAMLATAAYDLDALFTRRPDLEDMRCEIDVSSSRGTFSFTVRGMDVQCLESVLNIERSLRPSEDES